MEIFDVNTIRLITLEGKKNKLNNLLKKINKNILDEAELGNWSCTIFLSILDYKKDLMVDAINILTNSLGYKASITPGSHENNLIYMLNISWEKEEEEHVNQ